MLYARASAAIAAALRILLMHTILSQRTLQELQKSHCEARQSRSVSVRKHADPAIGELSWLLL